MKKVIIIISILLIGCSSNVDTKKAKPIKHNMYIVKMEDVNPPSGWYDDPKYPTYVVSASYGGHLIIYEDNSVEFTGPDKDLEYQIKNPPKILLKTRVNTEEETLPIKKKYIDADCDGPYPWYRCFYSDNPQPGTEDYANYIWQKYSAAGPSSRRSKEPIIQYAQINKEIGAKLAKKNKLKIPQKDIHKMFDNRSFHSSYGMVVIIEKHD